MNVGPFESCGKTGLERQETETEKGLFFFPGGIMRWRDTHPFLKCHRWRSCWVSWERLKHDCSPVVPCRRFAGLAGNTIEWFLTGGIAVSAGVCSTAGHTGSIFHLALFAWLVLFWKCESKTKAKQLGSFWWAGDRRGFGFLTGPMTGLGSFCCFRKPQLTLREMAPMWLYRYTS